MSLVLIGNAHGNPYVKAGVRGSHPLLKAFETAFNASQGLEANPSDSLLRIFTERFGGVVTTTGGIAVSSRVKSRSAKETREVSPNELEGVVPLLISKIHSTEWLAVPRTMCQDEGFKSNCLVVVPKEHARIGFMWGNTLFPPETNERGELKTPDSTVIFFPEWSGKRQILVVPEIGLTLVLASDYMGEAKKGNLRMIMSFVKRAGMGLGVHASSKTIYVLDKNGQIRTKGFALCGLSGTGKTALSASTHGLVYPEGVRNHQDDFVVLTPEKIRVENGERVVIRVKGTELGYYLKTEGMGEDPQDPLYLAALKSGVVFENVAIDSYGNLEFTNYEMHGTRNGRCVVNREIIANNSRSIDNHFSFLDTFVLIYRDPFLPPIALAGTPELGAAAFLALQSVVTSAATPKKEEWGKPTFEAGANPFMVPYTEAGIADEVCRFYELIKSGGINTVLLNTGEVGFGDERNSPKKITKPVSEKVIGEFARGDITFRESKITPGLLVPDSSYDEFDPEKVIPKEVFDKKFTEAVKAKKAFAKQFEPHFTGEHKKIVEAFYKAFKD